ncbi:MAG: ATP-binding protein [Thermodesulfobacteriota bacterium]|nr:MAG: ATP-binding protein [Thermodesulfobacteriota bacterium]
MATAEQIKILIRAHFENDLERFVTVALQIAAHEAKAGHASLAHDIRRYVDRAKQRYGLLPGVSVSRDLSDMLLQTKPSEHLSELIVHEDLRYRIARILDEYRHRQKLKQHGMTNRRRILLAGPPGTGKTMTASVLAGELHLPLHTILMHKLVTKFMGETSAKLRQIFDVIQEEPGIYLFDEFDAIGTQRGREHEVGEMRRVLNSFLQFIEQDASESMIIAATNTFDVLDTALFRRFDDVLYYELPDKNERAQLLQNRLNSYMSSALNIESLANEAESLSHAEISRACDDAIKQVLLTRQKKVTKKLLVSMLAHRKAIYSKKRG